MLRNLLGRFVLGMLCVMAWGSLLASSAYGQTFKVLHAFTNFDDGGLPEAGVTLDAAGNLYGTTLGTIAYDGVVFRMGNVNGSWVLNPLFTFTGPDGGLPSGRVVFGPHGTLYGTTSNFGGGTCQGYGCGVVFTLNVPASFCRSFWCQWNETVIHDFLGTPDGESPYYVDPVFDPAGNLYGTTYQGGLHGGGTVFQLTNSGGQWTENILYNFAGSDGQYPESGVILDAAGNAYGTTESGGAHENGSVYKLTPSGGGWTLTTLYDFPNASSDGANPISPLLLDSAGNLYGTASADGPAGFGTVFELSPSGGGWTYTVLYSFPADGQPQGNLLMDSAGSLYGVGGGCGSYKDGCVWKLTPGGSGWSFTDLYSFTGKGDGDYPVGGPAFDTKGNLYGTTLYGGFQSAACPHGCGVVWELTP
ncbi:MAG: choice-of-anchor tandem repeat GloVer-containing protein [Candidatus Korobacteraceae bacterium]